MAKFEKISKYESAALPMPERKTSLSAGYDLVAAEDTVIPASQSFLNNLRRSYVNAGLRSPLTLEEMGKLTKESSVKPTLVPTGMKCKLDPDTYLELSIRSSSPLKYWLILANGVGRLCRL